MASLHDVYYRSLEKSIDLEKKKHNHLHVKHVHRLQKHEKEDNISTTTNSPGVEDEDWKQEALPAGRHPEIIRK